MLHMHAWRPLLQSMGIRLTHKSHPHGNTARTELVASAASAPSLVPILTLADAQELRRREQTIRPKRSLHKLAREALNSISQAATDIENTVAATDVENTGLDAWLHTEDLETWLHTEDHQKS